MTTLRSKIITEVINVLNVDRPAGVPVATRLKVLPTDRMQFPTLNVYPGDEDVASINSDESPARQRTLVLYFEIRVAGDDPDELTDPMLEWITAKLGKTRLPTVEHPRGLVLGIQERRVQWRVSQNDRTYFVALASFEFRYKTKRDDQTVQS